MRIILIIAVLLLCYCINSHCNDGLWKVTAYCSCSACCGKSDGITASGRKAVEGVTIACNWLPFGTVVDIDGLGVYVVQDRGAKSLFGDKDNHIKHIDVYMGRHSKAREFGVRYYKVNIIK